MAWTDDFSYLLTHLELSEEYSSEYQLGNYIDIHTEENFPELDAVDVVILGVAESRRSAEEDVKRAPDRIREKLYRLFHHGREIKIADVGNIMPGEYPHDTDAGVKTVVKSLLDRNIVVLILGGSQELTFANYSAYEILETTVNLAVIDSAVDLGEFRDDLSPENFLSKIVLHDPSYLFNLSVLGYQTYHNDPASLNLMEKLFFDAHRLGQLKSDIKLTEPLLRNADVISFDMDAVSSGYSPASLNPNGFTGEQICQIARYAGMSDKASSIGFYNYSPGLDTRGTSAELLAQMVWCTLDGLSYRQKEYPLINKNNFVEYKVHMPDNQEEIVFYKSQRTDKWWMKVPYAGGIEGKLGRHHLVPCNYAEYELATQGELPDMWWRTYQKLG